MLMHVGLAGHSNSAVLEPTKHRLIRVSQKPSQKQRPLGQRPLQRERRVTRVVVSVDRHGLAPPRRRAAQRLGQRLPVNQPTTFAQRASRAHTRAIPIRRSPDSKDQLRRRVQQRVRHPFIDKHRRTQVELATTIGNAVTVFTAGGTPHRTFTTDPQVTACSTAYSLVTCWDTHLHRTIPRLPTIIKTIRA